MALDRAPRLTFGPLSTVQMDDGGACGLVLRAGRVPGVEGKG